MNKNRESFLLKWVLLTSLGWFLGGFLGFLITKSFFPESEVGAIDTSPLFWLIFGLFIGTFQWVLLRKEVIYSMHSWVIYTVFGYYIAALIIKTFSKSEIGLTDFWAHTLGGFIISYMQYRLLSRKFKNSGWWLLAATLSWVLAQEIIGINILFYFSGILIFSGITGFVMNWLLNQSVQKTPEKV